MTNDEFKEKQRTLIDLYHCSRIHRTLGTILTYTEDNRAHFELPYNPNFDHALDGIHGGAIATLIDNAGWFTAAQYYDTWLATAEFHVRLLAHARQETLFAVGEMVQVGKRTSVAKMELRGQDGRLIAIGSGTFMPTSAKIKID